jgi:hypothetical protein
MMILNIKILEIVSEKVPMASSTRHSICGSGDAVNHDGNQVRFVVSCGEIFEPPKFLS